MRASVHLVLTLSFLGIIFGVPVGQALHERLIAGESPTVAGLFRRAPSEENLRAFEKELDESSLVGGWLRHGFQVARWLALDELGEKALSGRAGFFFYTPEVTYLSGPYFRELRSPPSTGDPVDTIVDLRGQLRARGIDLLVVPVPSKPSIYPDRLFTGLRPGPELFNNTRRFLDELRGRGVASLDLHHAFLAERASRPERLLFMKSDTHWTGEGARLAAARIAAWVRARDWYRAPARPRYRGQAVEVSREGDIPRMTRMPLQQWLFPPEKVACHRVLAVEGGAPYEDEAGSPVLLL